MITHRANVASSGKNKSHRILIALPLGRFVIRRPNLDKDWTTCNVNFNFSDLKAIFNCVISSHAKICRRPDL